MRRIVLNAAVAAAISIMVAVPLAAQNVPSPGDVYGSTVLGRPAEMDPQDRINDPSVRDRIERGVRDNNLEKSAAAARADQGRARPAKESEILAGSVVNDKSGQQIATIEGIETDGAVLFNGAGRVKVPLEAFGHNKKGLLLDVTKSQFDELVASATGPAKS